MVCDGNQALEDLFAVKYWEKNVRWRYKITWMFHEHQSWACLRLKMGPGIVRPAGMSWKLLEFQSKSFENGTATDLSALAANMRVLIGLSVSWFHERKPLTCECMPCNNILTPHQHYICEYPAHFRLPEIRQLLRKLIRTGLSPCSHLESDGKSSKAACYGNTRPKQTPLETGSQVREIAGLIFRLERGGCTNIGSELNKDIETGLSSHWQARQHRNEGILRQTLCIGKCSQRWE